MGDIEAKVQRILELCLEDRQTKRQANASNPGDDPSPPAIVHPVRPNPPSSLGLPVISSTNALAAPLKPILVVDRGHETSASSAEAHHHHHQQQQPGGGGGGGQEDQHPSPVKKRVTLQS